MKSIKKLLVIMIVLGSIEISATDVNTRLIRDQADAQYLCPRVCINKYSKWDGNWTNHMTYGVCGCN